MVKHCARQRALRHTRKVLRFQAKPIHALVYRINTTSNSECRKSVFWDLPYYIVETDIFMGES